jgi:hypothetical protein
MGIDPRHELELAVKKLESDPSRWCTGKWGESALDSDVSAFIEEVPLEIFHHTEPFSQALRSVVADQTGGRMCLEGALVASLYERLGEFTETVAAYEAVRGWVDERSDLRLYSINDTGWDLEGVVVGLKSAGLL